MATRGFPVLARVSFGVWWRPLSSQRSHSTFLYGGFFMQVKLNVIVGAALITLGAAAYAQDVVIKIGHVAPTSGGQAHLGKDNENGARMAIDELNAKGVTIGGKKAKFELLAEDDGADPKQGTAAASKLADSKVSGVI